MGRTWLLTKVSSLTVVISRVTVYTVKTQTFLLLQPSLLRHIQIKISNILLYFIIHVTRNAFFQKIKSSDRSVLLQFLVSKRKKGFRENYNIEGGFNVLHTKKKAKKWKTYGEKSWILKDLKAHSFRIFISIRTWKRSRSADIPTI